MLKGIEIATKNQFRYFWLISNGGKRLLSGYLMERKDRVFKKRVLNAEVTEGECSAGHAHLRKFKIYILEEMQFPTFEQ